MATALAAKKSLTALTDLPGIGATKAKWLAKAGLGTIEALRAAPVNEIAHVRGVGYALAVRLKEVLLAQRGDGVATGGDGDGDAQTALTDAQAEWQARMNELCASVHQALDDLLEDPARRGLKPKFVAQLKRLRKVLQAVPMENPPAEIDERRRVAKQVKAINKLLESATQMSKGSANHQQALRKNLRSRRKKLLKSL